MKDPSELKAPESYAQKIHKPKTKHGKQETISGNGEGLLDPTFIPSFGAGIQGSVDQHPKKSLLEDFTRY